jgi:hypothetical protein
MTTIEKVDLTKELEVYKKGGANLLMPSTRIEGLSEFHRPVIETVTLSSVPDDGDVYRADDEEDEKKQKFRLSKQALMKLSNCAGIIWSTEHTKRVDDGKNRDYVCYQAVGGLKKSDGTPIYFKAQYDMDFEILEEELRILYEKKTKGKWAEKKAAEQRAEYVEFCVRRDMLQKRKHKLKLAEAGAMNRVVREILGLKNAYTKAELAKPFVMMRIVFRPDYSDKDVKAAMLTAHIQAMTGIYGGAVDSSIKSESEPIDVTPLTEAKNTEDPPEGDEPAPEGKPGDEKNSLLTDFQNSEELQQCKSLTYMSNQKGYDLADFIKRSKKKSLAEISKEKRLGLFEHLLSLPNKEVGGPNTEEDVAY